MANSNFKKEKNFNANIASLVAIIGTGLVTAEQIEDTLRSNWGSNAQLELSEPSNAEARTWVRGNSHELKVLGLIAETPVTP